MNTALVYQAQLKAVTRLKKTRKAPYKFHQRLLRVAMFRLLFLLFIIIPIIEITVLMQVGSLLGVGPTIAIVIITAWLGAKYVRQQGLSTLNSVQTKMAQGQMPSDEIVAGLMLLVAGVLLVTPGFVTDFFGLALLIPAFRSFLVKNTKQHINVGGAQSNHFHFNGAAGPTQQPPSDAPFKEPISHAHKGQTLEGEYERKE